MNRTTKTKKAYKPEKLELEGILALTKEDNLQRWAMLHLSYYAGLRSMEISQLDFGHVYKDGKVKNTAQLITKGGKERMIRLGSKKLISALTTWYKVQNRSEITMNTPLFRNPQGARFNANSVVKQFAKAYIVPNEGRHESERLSSHSGRRYFATVLGNTAGMTTKQLMALGGWESPEVALSYVETNEHVLDEHLGHADL